MERWRGTEGESARGEGERERERRNTKSFLARFLSALDVMGSFPFRVPALQLQDVWRGGLYSVVRLYEI